MSADLSAARAAESLLLALSRMFSAPNFTDRGGYAERCSRRAGDLAAMVERANHGLLWKVEPEELLTLKSVIDLGMREMPDKFRTGFLLRLDAAIVAKLNGHARGQRDHHYLPYNPFHADRGNMRCQVRARREKYLGQGAAHHPDAVRSRGWRGTSRRAHFGSACLDRVRVPGLAAPGPGHEQNCGRTGPGGVPYRGPFACVPGAVHFRGPFRRDGRAVHGLCDALREERPGGHGFCADRACRHARSAGAFHAFLRAL